MSDTTTTTIASTVFGPPTALAQQTSRLGAKGAAAGPLSSLDQNAFISDMVSYPLDLQDLGAAIMFNINIFTGQPITQGANPSDLSRSQQLRNTNPLQSGTIDTNAIANTISLGSVTDANLPSVTLNQKTTRIAKSIALYMPQGLQFDGNQDYETASLLDKWGAGGIALAQGLGSKDKIEAAAGAGMLLASVFSGKINSIFSPGGALQSAVKAGLGYAVNPVIEVLYNNPRLRTFNFTFDLVPRNSDEADAIWQIVQLFRQYSAPDINNGGKGLYGAFFTPPAQFDLTFLMRDPNGSGFVQNTNIPTIDTCALTRVNVTYNNMGGGDWYAFSDGFPVSTQIVLEMTELDIQTSSRIASGF